MKTLLTLSTVSETEKRIAIAKVRGWSVEPLDVRKLTFVLLNPKGQIFSGTCRDKAAAWSHDPDYFNDLNAIREAELSITPGATGHDDLWDRYTETLDTLAGPGMSVIASAAQRAEAFWRVVCSPEL